MWYKYACSSSEESLSRYFLIVNMKAAIRRAFGKLRKLLCVRACDEEETVPVVVEDEMRARDRLALKQFFARRGVTWPARQKMEQQPPWTVKLRKLYPEPQPNLLKDQRAAMAGRSRCSTCTQISLNSTVEHHQNGPFQGQSNLPDRTQFIVSYATRLRFFL